MASTAIERWDKLLGEIETKRRCIMVPVEYIKPGYAQFRQAFPMIVDVLTKDFNDAWESDLPVEGSDLYSVMERVTRAAKEFDFTQPAGPQVDRFMGVVIEARRELEIGLRTPKELVADLEKLLKTSVLVARVGHQGAMQIVDKERQERTRSINKATERPAQFLDLDSLKLVENPSKTAISMSVFLAMVDPGITTIQESFGPGAEENQAPILKQFAAQWVIHIYTEWEEYYRDALAAALGCDREAIRSEYFADLKRMRQDYVHKMRGIARNSAKNKVLKWYQDGDNMIPTHANYLQLLTEFPGDALLTPQPLPPAQRKPIAANADPQLVRQFEEAADRLGLKKDKALDQMITEFLAAHS
ncbi:hypothetical protein [Mycolicibacterium aubagnense]|nr:hypothetical protein [Mycolicibacterium aubagnense]WGI31610.1 hypothetical protein QDT91_20615 [Mycolicibacterium aubagnense]